MKPTKNIKILLLILVLFFLTITSWTHGCAAPPNPTETAEVVIAMCRPQVSQIKNIRFLYESNILPIEKLKLIGVYHEDEIIDYEPAQNYVDRNNLSWVSFVEITGKVPLDKLFQQNQWTSQFKSLFKKTNGIIFTGGADIPPAIYGEDQILLTVADTPNRSFYEVSFLFHLIGSSRNPGFKPFLQSQTDYPILAICLGAQTMNVAAGGTLYQDIPSQVYKFKTVQQVLKQDQDDIHSVRYLSALHPLDDELASTFHRIKYSKKSIYVKRLGLKKGGNPYVLTAHHQAVKDLGKNLKITATSMDGKIAETLEHKKYKNVLGVQFHPEYYGLYLKGIYYRKTPNGPLNFNMRQFLIQHSPSMQFHRAIWSWFAQSVSY